MRWPWIGEKPFAVARPLAVRLDGEPLRVRALESLATRSVHMIIVDRFPDVAIELLAGPILVVDGIDSDLERAFVHHLADGLRVRIGLDRAGGNQDPKRIVVTVPDAWIGAVATASYRALLAIAEAR